MANDRVSSVEAHYVRHVLGGQEWPAGTTLAQYLASIQQVFLDSRSGILISFYQGAWQLAAVRRSYELQGPSGRGWVLVEYRVGLGRWVTAY